VELAACGGRRGPARRRECDGGVAVELLVHREPRSHLFRPPPPRAAIEASESKSSVLPPPLAHSPVMSEAPPSQISGQVKNAQGLLYQVRRSLPSSSSSSSSPPHIRLLPASLTLTLCPPATGRRCDPGHGRELDDAGCRARQGGAGRGARGAGGAEERGGRRARRGQGPVVRRALPLLCPVLLCEGSLTDALDRAGLGARSRATRRRSARATSRPRRQSGRAAPPRARSRYRAWTASRARSRGAPASSPSLPLHESRSLVGRRADALLVPLFRSLPCYSAVGMATGDVDKQREGNVRAEAAEWTKG